MKQKTLVRKAQRPVAGSALQASKLHQRLLCLLLVSNGLTRRDQRNLFTLVTLGLLEEFVLVLVWVYCAASSLSFDSYQDVRYQECQRRRRTRMARTLKKMASLRKTWRKLSLNPPSQQVLKWQQVLKIERCGRFTAATTLAQQSMVWRVHVFVNN